MSASATSTPASVRVLLVDDQAPARDAIREVVKATAHFELVGEAASKGAALETAADVHPDLALVDVRINGLEGMEICWRLTTADPSVVVVLVSVDDSLSLPSQVGFCGAAEVILKQELRPALLRRIWRVHGHAAKGGRV
jgi:DNA-binding NarL/FixJ family response regulator